MPRIAVICGIALITTLGPPASWAQAPKPPAKATQDGNQENAAKAVVLEFGKRLGQVSVLAPRATAAAEMDRVYAPFVTADLLARWKKNPEKAPGKTTSSPSPERIDIANIKANGSDAYTVTGQVILLTAKERRDGGVFASNPVTIKLTRKQGKWVITAYDEKPNPN